MQSPAERSAQLFATACATPGFLPEHEATALRAIALHAAQDGLVPFVEVGAYRGRSGLVLASALAWTQGSFAHVVFSVDHHRGSEEMQAGWPDHDPSLIDAQGRMDSLSSWRDAISSAGAEDLVIGVVGDSRTIAANWSTPIGLLFLDGGHGEQIAWDDYRNWSAHLTAGGYLVFHDVFEDPAQGGRPPHDCYKDALASREYLPETAFDRASLRVLRRRGRAPKASAVAPFPSASSASSTAAAE